MADVASFGAALDTLCAAMGGGLDLRHGADLGYRESGNADYAIVATFADRAAWDAYQAHPLHKAFIVQQATPLAASRVAIQLEGAGSNV